jgi:hypothetical protein
MLVPAIAASAVGLVLVVVIVVLVLGGRDGADDPSRIGGTGSGSAALATTGTDGGDTGGETDRGPTSGPATTAGELTDGGATDAGATEGGTSDSNSTDGGSTDGRGSDSNETQPPPMASPLADGSIDLLARVDPAKDAISGNWTRQGALLLCTAGSRESCAIAYEPTGAYELQVDIRRLTANGVIQIHLPVGSSAATLGIHGKRSDGLFVAGLAISGGTSPGTIATVVDPPAADVVHRVRAKVTPSGNFATIAVDMDGRQIAFWKGPQSSLSSRMKDLPNPHQIVVGGYSAALEFQRIQIWDKATPPIPTSNLPPPVASIDAPENREAVPELAAQEETLKRVQELFKAEYAAARTDAEKVELAQTLAKTSGDSKAPAVERYVLLSEASRLAVEGARADVAMVIIDAIGRNFETDTFQLKADALGESLKHMRLDDQRKQLANLAWTASGAALDAKQFEACGSLLKTVLSCVARPRDDDAREMRRKATLRLLELQKLKQQADDAAQG